MAQNALSAAIVFFEVGAKFQRAVRLQVFDSGVRQTFPLQSHNYLTATALIMNLCSCVSKHRQTTDTEEQDKTALQGA